MAMVKAILSLAVSVAVLVDSATATSYTVGGSGRGWDSSTDLHAWASLQTFLVGDALIFNYPPNHDVVEVSKTDYDACRGSNPLESHTGGNTVVPLTSPSNRYFICGTMGHCSHGMKVEIHTLAASALSPENSPLASPSSMPPVTLSSRSPESGALAPVTLSPAPAPAPIDALQSKSGTFAPRSSPAPMEDDALQCSPSPEIGDLMPVTLSPAPAPIDAPRSSPAPMDDDDALESSPTLGSGAVQSPLGSSDGSFRVVPSAKSLENSAPPSYPAARIDALIQCLVGFGFTMVMLHTL
ncbi:uclacyanin 1-like [Diospyros lotus]|uniref:uclacyanin 1-like n=1 Tax=Diospyros lotus TaxID=55363 RepID=UPI00225211B1|nr:uclacyanin 1-like [Diospyros lotus]